MRQCLVGFLFKASIRVDFHPAKKNTRSIFSNKKTGKWFLGKDSRLKAQEDFLTGELRSLWKKNEPLTCDLAIKYLFFFQKSRWFTLKGTRNKNVPDLDNLICLPQDCLIRAGVIKDDNLVMSYDGTRKCPGDFTHLEIEIKDFGG